MNWWVGTGWIYGVCLFLAGGVMRDFEMSNSRISDLGGEGKERRNGDRSCGRERDLVDEVAEWIDTM